MRKSRLAWAACLILTVPSVALANTGTPLVWADGLHLVFGNFFVGCVEGLVLAMIFGLSKRRCVKLMILANYFSAWLGGNFIVKAIARALPVDLHNVWPLLGLMVGIAYLLTLLLEFPFVARAFRGDAAWCRKAILGSLLIQTVSYAGLVGYYAQSSALVPLTNIVDISSVSLPENIRVCFISAADGDVYAGSLRERQWRNIFDLNSSNRHDRLFVRPSALDTNVWDLAACLETGKGQSPNLVTIQERFAAVVAPPWRTQIANPHPYQGTAYDFGQVSKLGEARSSAWKFRTAYWAYDGLTGTETNSRERVHIAFETPFVNWHIRKAVHLPTDKVLFQLGDEQICLYDPVKKQVARVARGRGPVAVVKNEKE